MINADRVDKMFKDCLFKEDELIDGQPPDGWVQVDGILDGKYGFHPERLMSYYDEITDMLKQLPVAFREKGGGGWTFLNACNTEDGQQWTGLHQRMEQLFCMAIGLKLAKYQFPRDLWKSLPGGMPYISIAVTEQKGTMNKMWHVNTERVSIPTQGEENIVVSYVLTSGVIERDRDFAVYVGIGDTLFIMHSGAKLRYEAAQIHFPFLPEEKYRR